VAGAELPAADEPTGAGTPPADAVGDGFVGAAGCMPGGAITTAPGAIGSGSEEHAADQSTAHEKIPAPNTPRDNARRARAHARS
jgi:hypothetical protein